MPSMPEPQISTKATVRASIGAIASDALADNLLDEYDELNKRFDLADFRPSELSGGRFSEAAFRVCEQVCTGTSTPVGKTLPKVDLLIPKLAGTPPGKVDDTF